MNQQNDTGGRKVPRRRDQEVETLRIIAAAGIVYYHAEAPIADVAYSGLVIFLLLSPLMDFRYNWARQTPPTVLARKLLIPWAFWMVVYSLRNIAAHKPIFQSNTLVTGILYGTNGHLWFLPYLFICLLLLGMVKRTISPIIAFWLLIILASVLLFSAALWRPVTISWGFPWAQWVHAAPAIAIGAAIGLASKVGRSSYWGAVIIFAAVLVADLTADSGLTVAYSIGIILTVTAVKCSGRIFPARYDVQFVADCMFGVYLTHVIWVLAFSRILGDHRIAVAALAFACALLSVAAARRYVPPLQKILG